MAKVHINGETFEWDPFGSRPLSEALFIERVTRNSYAVWEDEAGKKLAENDMGTLALLLAVTLRRAGHEVSEEDARNGTFTVGGEQVDLLKLEFVRDEGDAEPPDPTTEAAPKEASPTTQASTSRRSASSASGPGR